MTVEEREIRLGGLVHNFDSRRIPLSNRERQNCHGPYPYYGATGIMDYVDDFLFDGLYLLVAEDGSVERPDGKPFVQLVNGKFWANNHAHVLKGATDEDTKFLYYALKAIPIRPFVSGSVQAKLSQANMNRIPIPYPMDRVERRAIAHILGTLDDKIELNRRMNQTLEAIAQAIFKSWFVDFDPVRAKAEGRQPVGMDAETAALFPDSFVESELGPIPKGWDVAKLGDKAFLSRENLKPLDYPQEIFSYYSIPAFDDRLMPYLEKGDVIKSNKFIVQPTSILLSKLNPLISRVWLPTITEDYRSICSTEFLVVVPKDVVFREYFYALFSSKSFMNIYATLVTGTSGSHQRIKPDSFLDIVVAYPKTDAVSMFSDIARPLYCSISRSLSELETITHMRDALLPKLLSGELRPPDAERMVGAVT